MGGFYTWSKTASSNATADSTIGWAEGQAPSSINDSARAMMARTAEFRDDISGTITSTGSSTAYVVASNQGFSSLATMNGAMIAFIPHATNGATVTLNVDGLGAKALRLSPSVELQSGVLILGTPYVATFVNADSAWYLQGAMGNPYGIPLGGMMPYIGSTAPNSAFVIPIGQAISRTTYATLFTLTSTTYGIGDGSTTFNVPDLRGRTVFGQESGGSGRITVAGGNADGTVLGQAVGGQNQILTQAQLPNVNFTVSGITATAGGTNIDSGLGSNSFLGRVNSPDYQATVTITAQGTAASGGSGSAHTILSPGLILPYILRVI